jgi:hypothetical protein
MNVSQTLSDQSESSLTEANPYDAFQLITHKVSEFDSYLSARTYSDGSMVPYFLYVITPNREGKLISFSNADNLNDILNTTELDSNNSQDSISHVIKQHISEGLQQLYNSSSSSSVASSISKHSQVVPINSTTVDRIINYYSQNLAKLPSAVTTINNTYNIALKPAMDEAAPEESSTGVGSQQPTTKTNYDNIDDITTLRKLLTFPENQNLLNDKEYIDPDKEYIDPKAGGSRSRKHRRRHRKKNRTTKRRNRK